RTDGSLGHLFGYHNLALHQVHLRGSEAQSADLYRRSAAGNWFWGNASNPMSQDLSVRRERTTYVLAGRRPFTSGSHIADRIMVSWTDDATGQRTYTTVPTDRDGIRPLDDWDAIGQRQTGSGTVVFDNLRVEAE